MNLLVEIVLLLVSILDEHGKKIDDGEGLKEDGEPDKNVPLLELGFLLGNWNKSLPVDISFLNFS